MSLLVAFALLLGPVIDYEPDGARMEVLLEDLSKKLERKLVPSAEVRDDVLVISARGVSPDELLDKMAEALAATWDKRSETWTLIRTPEQRKSRTERTERQTLEWIRRAIKQSVQSQGSKAAFDTQEAETLARAAMTVEPGQPRGSFNYELRLPVQRAAEALLQTIPAEVISKLPLGERVVFSSKPNKLQRAFPSSVDSIINDLRAQFALLETALAKQPKFERGNQSLWPFYWMLLPEGKRVESVLLVVKRDPASLTLRGLVLDQDGLDLSNGGGSWHNLSRFDFNAPVDTNLPNTEVELSPTAKAWINLSQTAYGPVNYTTDLGTFVRHCSRRDPLGLLFTDGVRDYARALDRSVVLAPTDGCFMDFFMTTRVAKLSVRTFARTLHQAMLEPKEAGGWIVGKQPFPDNSAFERIDRKAVEALAKAYDVEGAASLDAAAAFAIRQPEGAWTGFLSRLLSRIGPGIGVSLYSMPMLRVYGLAPAAQKQGLRAGRAYLLAELSAGQQDAIRRGAFHIMNWENELRFDQTRLEYVRVMDLQASGYRADITEMFPNGIPSDAPVQLSASSATIAFMKQPNGITTAGLPTSSMSYTVWRANQDATADKLLFKQGKQVSWDLGVGLDRVISKHFLYNETRSTGDWGPLSALPKPFLEELEMHMKGYSPGDGKGGGKPPPP